MWSTHQGCSVSWPNVPQGKQRKDTSLPNLEIVAQKYGRFQLSLLGSPHCTTVTKSKQFSSNYLTLCFWFDCSDVHLSAQQLCSFCIFRWLFIVSPALCCTSNCRNPCECTTVCSCDIGNELFGDILVFPKKAQMLCTRKNYASEFEFNPVSIIYRNCPKSSAEELLLFCLLRCNSFWHRQNKQ